MTTQVFVKERRPVKTEALLDVSQALSGVFLILFMWSHMVLVASVNLGTGVLNSIAEFLERYYLAQLGGPMIGFLFLAHFVLAARKLPFRIKEQKAIWSHSLRFKHLDTWLWVIQALTAMIILIMGSTHMWTVLTSLPISAQKSAMRIQGGWWFLFYALLLPIVELHVGIGFYRIGVKWGWIQRANRHVFKRLENRMTLAFVAVGLITLLNFYFLVSISD
jgi:fumarate reductase subunit C